MCRYGSFSLVLQNQLLKSSNMYNSVQVKESHSKISARSGQRIMKWNKFNWIWCTFKCHQYLQSLSNHLITFLLFMLKIIICWQFENLWGTPAPQVLTYLQLTNVWASELFPAHFLTMQCIEARKIYLSSLWFSCVLKRLLITNVSPEAKLEAWNFKSWAKCRCSFLGSHCHWEADNCWKLRWFRTILLPLNSIFLGINWIGLEKFWMTVRTLCHFMVIWFVQLKADSSNCHKRNVPLFGGKSPKMVARKGRFAYNIHNKAVKIN